MTIADAAKQWVNDKGDGVQFGGGDAPASDDKDKFQTLENICEVGWQAHIAWERIIGDDDESDETGREWSELTDGRRHHIYNMVRWMAEHPTASVAAQHDAWRASIAANEPDHPNLVPFDELPFAQQVKARLWRHIIFAVLG